MNSKTFLNTGAIAAAMMFCAQSLTAQHLEAGAVGQNQNDALVWANAGELAASSGYVHPLTLATTGRYAGLYNGNITLVAMSSTEAGGPALGSFIQAEIVSVAGPSGAFFGFWDSLDLGGGATPTYNIATGSEGLTLRYVLSDASAGAGQAGQDPAGHLHGRRFTASELGMYTVGFRAVDTSVNGAGGGSIHTASDIVYINFQAVPEPSVLALVGAGLAGLCFLRRKRNA
jgi:hypothetical protein